MTRYLDQKTAKGPFRFSSQTIYHLLLPVYPLIGKVEAIQLNALPKDTTSELASLSSHYLSFMLNVKQGSCEYQLFEVFLSDLARESNPGSPTFNTKKLNFIV